MSLNKIDKRKVFNVVKKTIEGSSIFRGYDLKNTNYKSVKSPTIKTQYDLRFESPQFNRWLFVRIEDYHKYQKTIIWLNKLDKSESVNFDIERFFVEVKKIKKFKNQVIFKTDSLEKLDSEIKKLLEQIEGLKEGKLNDIIEGRDWSNLPFDWMGYK